MINLNDKMAVIIGSANELTGSVAACLSTAGAKINFLCHSKEAGPGQHLQQALQATIISGDLNSQAGIQQQIDLIAKADIAIISPGWFQSGFFMETSPDQWDEALLKNFERAVYASQAIARKMIAQGNGGRILFLTSVATLMPFVESAVFGTSLATLRAVAKMAAVDLAPHKITVNMVAAGWIETEQTRPFLSQKGRAFIQQGIPSGKIGSPSDIGNLCCFLASDLAGYITGSIIPVDGGYILTRSPGKSPFPEANAESPE